MNEGEACISAEKMMRAAPEIRLTHSNLSQNFPNEPNSARVE